MNKILIAAGGTGGHIFPALAVANSLQKKNVEVRWLGAKTGLEQQIVKDKFHLYSLGIKALRGGGIIKKITALLLLFKSVIQALFIIRSYKPDVLLAMGGYASAPGIIAAWMLRVPVIIHEQNARAGMTNKYLAKLATKTLAGFAGAFPADQCVVVGNPVRQKIIDIAQKKFSDERELRILVIGGSQGAKFFNDNFPEMFYEISKKRELKIFHQVGKRQIEKVEDEYVGQNARAVQFIDDMPVAYEWADVVIARAGASTVAELAACAVPSIFVPFPAAVDDHQYYNAQALQQAGAAWVVRQGDQAVSEIMAYIIELNSDKLYAASHAARTVAAYKSTDLIAAACMDIGTKGA